MRNFARLLCLSFFALALLAQQPVYPNRWVYVSRNLRDDRQVEDIRGIARTASEHGLNGMVLTGLDQLDTDSPDYLKRLEQVKAIVKQYSLEIIPIIYSAGYGGAILRHNRNLAEGLPVKDALFVVRNGEARLAAEPPVALVNGSEVAVKPYHCYRVTLRVKTDGLPPRASFRVQIRAPDNRSLAPWDPRVPSTTDWHTLTLGFNSFSYDKVTISAGAGAANAGKFQVDNLRLEEVGLVNVLRRPGAPLTVRSQKTGTVYEEDRDYAPVADPQLTFRFDHDGPPIRILPGSRIREGERLLVSYYHGMGVNRGQVSVCMSEPEVYEIWGRQARAIHQNLRPRQYLLSMDEIRAGGSCQACKSRKLTMAQILGDCLTRQFRIIRELNPQAEVWSWSDMLDPNHNARGNYYLVDGDYSGSWNYIPKDLRIVCWYYERRRESLRHFSSLGFKTLAGAYYDADTLDNPKGWLEALKDTPGALGIMYTTWQNKYQLLAPFGDLLRTK
jgi:hypothetical protein